MRQCIVIIPLYKNHPSKIEIASFRQGLSILKDHDISIITHTEVNLTVYYSIAQEVGKSFNVQYFDKNYFSSVSGYNKLCLSTTLYERFANYEYMLIYQTDAWVFKDELEYWCNKGYDYIGAPNFYNDGIVHTNIFWGVGNGGFSLRRIQYCIKVLNSYRNIPFLRPNYLLKYYYNEEKYINKKNNTFIQYLKITLKTILKSLGFKNTLNYFINSKTINEDIIFSIWAKNSWTIIPQIPNVHEAAFFSFECNPHFLYQHTKCLPFGCHAFEKWDYDTFWSKFIKL